MSDANAKPEPNMEEILASIRRIISDDGDSAHAAARPGASEPPADVLELTEMMNEDGTITDLSRAEAAAPSAPAEGIVSAAAAGDVALALGGLAGLRGGARQLPLGDGSKTVEGLVRELLKPLLKAWLDEHLPALVERLVEREIQRISSRADET